MSLQKGIIDDTEKPFLSLRDVQEPEDARSEISEQPKEVSPVIRLKLVVEKSPVSEDGGSPNKVSSRQHEPDTGGIDAASISKEVHNLLSAKDQDEELRPQSEIASNRKKSVTFEVDEDS